MAELANVVDRGEDVGAMVRVLIDNRPLPGPWSYELGTRIRVTAQSQLIALRFWKEPGETGTHVGRLWSSTGTQLASATFQNESASGWQRQMLASPGSQSHVFAWQKGDARL